MIYMCYKIVMSKILDPCKNRKLFYMHNPLLFHVQRQKEELRSYLINIHKLVPRHSTYLTCSVSKRNATWEGKWRQKGQLHVNSLRLEVL